MARGFVLLETSDHLRFQQTEPSSGVVAAPFPSVFKEGRLRDQINGREASLAAQTGWLVKGRVAILYTRPKGAPYLFEFY
jgi:hypothetical protein